MKAMKDGFQGRVACYFDFKASTFRAEFPWLIEMSLAHQPVDNRFDDRLSFDASLLGETLGSHQDFVAPMPIRD